MVLFSLLTIPVLLVFHRLRTDATAPASGRLVALFGGVLCALLLLLFENGPHSSGAGLIAWVSIFLKWFFVPLLIPSLLYFLIRRLGFSQLRCGYVDFLFSWILVVTLVETIRFSDTPYFYTLIALPLSRIIIVYGAWFLLTSFQREDMPLSLVFLFSLIALPLAGATVLWCLYSAYLLAAALLSLAMLVPAVLGFILVYRRIEQ